jgi:hypothetical protein
MCSLPSAGLRALALSCLLLCTACATPQQAARLADLTSAHVNSLNTELQAYVSDANASRKNDALLLAADQQYFQSLKDEAAGEVRAWRADPGNTHNKDKVSAFESLQQDATADMSQTDSSLQQQANRITAMEANYGTLTYSPIQMQSIITALQTLSKRASATSQISTFKTFSKTVLDDTRNGLEAASPNPNGVGVKKSPN